MWPAGSRTEGTSLGVLGSSEDENVWFCGRGRVMRYRPAPPPVLRPPGLCRKKWTQPRDCCTPSFLHSASLNSRSLGTMAARSRGRMTCLHVCMPGDSSAPQHYHHANSKFTCIRKPHRNISLSRIFDLPAFCMQLFAHAGRLPLW